MGNMNRLGLPLLFFTLLGVVCATRLTSSLYKVSLGSVTLYDEDRTTMLQMIVPIQSSLFGSGNQYNQDAMDSVKELTLTSSNYCKYMDQDAGDHPKLPWGAPSSNEPLTSESVKNLKHKYDLALQELVNAQALDVNQLNSNILRDAIRPALQQLPNPKGTTITFAGCSVKSELIISLTSGAAIDSDVPMKIYEVADYGRFVNGKKAFVRIDIARHWAFSNDKEAWYRVDFQRCEKSDKEQLTTQTWICPMSALSIANECTPTELNGCPVDVDFTSGNFVTNFSMPNGSVVVASNMQHFETHTGATGVMPSSGVILADLTPEARLKFGEVKIKNEDSTAKVFKWNNVSTEASMVFADMHVYDADFDPSGWAFQISTNSYETLTIEGRRTGLIYVVAAFIVENVWWCLVVSIAVVLSVALTLLTLFCRGRISSAYREYSPRLQRKRSPSASRSESSTSNTEDDPEIGDADEEFQAARKKKLSFSQFKISFLGDKGAPLSERAPTALSVASDDSTDSWRQRYYKNLRQLVTLQSLKAKKPSTDEEDTDSNIATDGSDAEKTTTAASELELTSVKVDENPLANTTAVGNSITIFDVAKFLTQSTIPEGDLVDVRHSMLRTRRKPNGDNKDTMLMNLVDFFALIKHGPNITQSDYEKIMMQEGLPREDCSRLGYALKGLHLKCAQNAGRVYRFHHLVKKFPSTYIIDDTQMGKTTMADFYQYNYGYTLRCPGLPVVAVYPPGGHREFLPIECLNVHEDQELIFASIRLARLAAETEKLLKSTEARVKAELMQKQQQQAKTPAITAPAAKAQSAQ